MKSTEKWNQATLGRSRITLSINYFLLGGGSSGVRRPLSNDPELFSFQLVLDFSLPFLAT